MKKTRELLALVIGITLYIIYKAIAIIGLVVTMSIVCIYGVVYWILSGGQPQGGDWIANSYGDMLEYLDTVLVWVYCKIKGDMTYWNSVVEERKRWITSE